jgi:hypothetical protein
LRGPAKEIFRIFYTSSGPHAEAELG